MINIRPVSDLRNKYPEIEELVLKEDEGKKVGNILRDKLNVSSRLLNKLKMNGKILVNRTSVFSSYILHLNDEIEVNIDFEEEDNIIPEKNHIIDNMLRIYESIDKSNKYDDELNEIDKQLKIIEDKKSLALDLVLSGELRKDELKVQFANFESTIKELSKKKLKILEQINILNERDSNIEKITKSIQEEIDGGSLEDFIRKFVDEIIVSKIDDDRYNIKLDINI